jgi:cobalt-zinc-cadmium efflux system outer membrane protein
MKSSILSGLHAFVGSVVVAFTAQHLHAQVFPGQTPTGAVSAGSNRNSNNEISPVGEVRLLEPVAVFPGQDSLPVAMLPATGHLTVEGVVQQVLAKNQSLAQMAAAWEAASAKYPQATSRDDPMFSSMVAPNSFGSQNVQPGYRVEISQKILWPGKKDLRGQIALAEAGAAGSDVDDMKLQLIEMARNAYYEYFLVQRAQAVNEDALKLLEESRRNAETRFRTGQIPQQDILQADVEIGKQRERGITLERMRRVAIARLDTLMHQGPSDPLGSPPATLSRGGPLPPANHLIASAVARRPDFRALENRIASDRAALALANKEYCPTLKWPPPTTPLWAMAKCAIWPRKSAFG